MPSLTATVSWPERTPVLVRAARLTTLDRMRTPGRFPMTIIQHAIWLYHHFSFSYRDVRELLHQRGIQVSIVVNGRP